MDLEKEWTSHPVVRLDMSGGGETSNQLYDFFDRTFTQYETKYGVSAAKARDLTGRLETIIQAAANATGRQVVILIDEYDFPLQHSWGTAEHEKCTQLYRSVFTVLKSEAANERFVFITGITKFTQISLFSVNNNLTNISFLPEYATICGMTRDEIVATFMPEIETLAQKQGLTTDMALAKMKDYYDGYHFSAENMVDVYNPFSVVQALSVGNIKNFWVSSGATNILTKFVSDLEMNLDRFNICSMDPEELETSDVMEGRDELFLYQSGYLTIKSYDADVESYTLGFPNTEVRKALYKVVAPILSARPGLLMDSTLEDLRTSLLRGELCKAKEKLKALVWDVPYSNKKMQSMDMEERYRFIISMILKAAAMDMEVEHMMANGRIDILARNKRYIYVIELKLTKAGGLAAAERQIISKCYAAPFKGDARKVVALAVEIADDGKGIVDWKEVHVE